MRIKLLILLTLAAGFANAQVTYIKTSSLIDGRSDAPKENQVIVIRGNRIESVGTATAIPDGAHVIDLTGMTVMPGLIDSHTHIFLQAEDPVEARKAAREQLDHGADWIKVYMTHRSWLDKQGNLVSQPTLTVDELRAIVDEAHGWKRKVACHAYNGEGLHRALDGGCDSIEHGLDLDDAAIAQMLKQGTWYVPTLSVYYDHNSPPDTPAGKRDRKRVALHGPSFQRAMKAGVKIAFGTDVGGFSWSEPIAQEFGRMVSFGMAPMDAIKSATSRAAELLGMTDDLGVIAPGAYADVVAVDGDPLKNVDVLKDVRFVMKDGKVFKPLR